MMKTFSLPSAIGGLFLGAIITFGVISTQNKPDSQMIDDKKTGSMQMTGMDMSMSEMNKELKTKQGDAFDKAFLAMMIDHHQGAIDMANEAMNNAGHQEIKDLSADIIEAQTIEIKQMKDWQAQWGY